MLPQDCERKLGQGRESWGVWTGQVARTGLSEHCLCAPLLPTAPLLSSTSSPSYLTCWRGWGPERVGAGEVITEVLVATHTGVGDNGEARACPVLGDTGLLILFQGTPLGEH